MYTDYETTVIHVHLITDTFELQSKDFKYITVGVRVRIFKASGLSTILPLRNVIITATMNLPILIN